MDWQAVTKEMSAAAEMIRAEAMERRNNAGYSGQMDDGGARLLEEQVEVFMAGVNGVVPEAWRSIIKRRTHLADPEYQKYLELKAKFEP